MFAQRHLIAAPCAALALFLSPSAARGEAITFETIPGVGAPTEGMEISDQFLPSAGVSFSLEGGGFPRIAQVGGPATAFNGPPTNTGDDNPLPGQRIGDYFLTDDGVLGGLTSPALILSYDSPTNAASGVILDIDFDESFTIEPRDASGNVLETITITAGEPDTGDGVATPWSFQRAASDVHSIRFQGARQAAGVFGLGFDNFDARFVPEPGSGLLIVMGSIACVGIASRSRRRTRGRWVLRGARRAWNAASHTPTRSFLWAALWTVSAACTPTMAELTAYDGFSYRAGSSLAGETGGGSFGFSSAWTAGGLATPQHEISGGSLADPTSTLLTEGARASVLTVSPEGFTTARRELTESLGEPGTRRYVSFLARPEGELGAGDAGGYFGLELVSSGVNLFVGKPSTDVYAMENIGGTDPSPTGVAAAVGESVFMVLRADFETGADAFRLYMNPSPGQAEPATPDAVKADSDVGAVSAVGMFSTGAFSLDEIRIGETFADVAPVPEPTSALFSPLLVLAMGARPLRKARRRRRSRA